VAPHTVNKYTQTQMKTKALLLTVALGVAGAATSMAQVYSQNAVGYINISVPAGFSMIANQLVQPSYALSALIPSPLPSTSVYKLTPSGYQISVFDDLDLVWTPNPAATIDLGGGVFINSPGPQTITFVGEVPTGTLTTDTPTGFSIRSSQVPQAGTVSQLGLIGQPSDSIYKYVPGTGYQISVFDDLDLVWTPAEPTIAVGEAFFLNKAPGGSATWVRTFTVN
jgi:hypothetical protein